MSYLIARCPIMYVSVHIHDDPLPRILLQHVVQVFTAEQDILALVELSRLVYGGGGGVRAIMRHQEELVILGDLREQGAQIMLKERVGEVGVGLVDGGL